MFIDRYVAQEMTDLHLPGLALGIVQGSQVVHLKGFGRADPGRRPVYPQRKAVFSKEIIGC